MINLKTSVFFVLIEQQNGKCNPVLSVTFTQFDLPSAIIYKYNLIAQIINIINN